MSDQLSNEEFEEHLKSSIGQLTEMRNYIRSIGIDLGVKSIQNIRTWTFEIMTLSSAILGVFIAIGSSNPMIKNTDFLNGALAIFILNILFGAYKLKSGFEKDINEIPLTVSKYCDKLSNVIDAQQKFMLEKTQESFEHAQQVAQEGIEPEQKDKVCYDFDIIFSLFFIGLILIGYSIKQSFGNVLLLLFICFAVKFVKNEIKNYKMRNQGQG